MTGQSPSFDFLDPGPVDDGTLALDLVQRQRAEESIWEAPAYIFQMRDMATNQTVGRVSLRIGETRRLTHWAGQIGYQVEEAFRGRHYAERSCRLLLPFFRRHGMRELWITCGPDNLASRRTLERLGATLVEIVDLPPDYPLPAGEIRKKWRFRVAINEGSPACQRPGQTPIS